MQRELGALPHRPEEDQQAGCNCHRSEGGEPGLGGFEDLGETEGPDRESEDDGSDRQPDIRRPG